MTDALPTLAFLGAGSMGGAIARGVVASGQNTRILATNRTVAKAAELAQGGGIESIALEETPDGNTRATAAADVVIVGVKPVGVADLLREIAPSLRPGSIVVSLAVGVPLRVFTEILGPHVAVVRSMPNTPSLVGKGMTGISRGAAASERDVAVVRRMFATVGAVLEVPESQLDALSTISGSGPAYLFLFAETLTRAAEHQGLSGDHARLLAEQTIIGAAALLESTGEDPAELRRRVTSPGGTTEQAIATFTGGGLEALVARATDAALSRARELAADS